MARRTISLSSATSTGTIRVCTAYYGQPQKKSPDGKTGRDCQDVQVARYTVSCVVPLSGHAFTMWERQVVHFVAGRRNPRFRFGN